MVISILGPPLLVCIFQGSVIRKRKPSNIIVTAWQNLGLLGFLLTFEVATPREDLASGLSVILPLSVERSLK